MTETSGAVRSPHISYDEFGVNYYHHVGAGGYSDPVMSAGCSFDCSPTKVSDISEATGASGASDTKTDISVKDFRYKKGSTDYTFRIHKSMDEGTDTVSVKISNSETKQCVLKCIYEVDWNKISNTAEMFIFDHDDTRELHTNIYGVVVVFRTGIASGAYLIKKNDRTMRGFYQYKSILASGQVDSISSIPDEDRTLFKRMCGIIEYHISNTPTRRPSFDNSHPSYPPRHKRTSKRDDWRRLRGGAGTSYNVHGDITDNIFSRTVLADRTTSDGDAKIGCHLSHSYASTGSLSDTDTAVSALHSDTTASVIGFPSAEQTQVDLIGGNLHAILTGTLHNAFDKHTPLTSMEAHT